MNKKDIKFTTDDKKYKKAQALAAMMEMSVEKLTEHALDSFLYTVKEHLNNIEEHVFPLQIMFD